MTIGQSGVHKWGIRQYRPLRHRNVYASNWHTLSGMSRPCMRTDKTDWGTVVPGIFDGRNDPRRWRSPFVAAAGTNGPPIAHSECGSARSTTRPDPARRTPQSASAPSQHATHPTEVLRPSGSAHLSRRDLSIPIPTPPRPAAHPTMIKHLSDLVLEITAQDPETLENDLNTAEEIARNLAMQERRHGILVTQNCGRPSDWQGGRPRVVDAGRYPFPSRAC